ncbi:MAG TPA: DUF6677 family protein [Vicinamibacterales bacterium]|nr:DUF6677 family protein [Vicinamibacterales bacterium]
MMAPANPSERGGRSTRAPAGARPRPVPTLAAAWLVPGGGHFLQGQTQKAVVFGVTLLLMFVVGLAFGGRLFALQLGDPLVFLAAVAQWAMLAPRLVAAVFGLGAGDVVAVSYEYGNAFLIAGGLLNMLVMLDALDLASGRKAR